MLARAESIQIVDDVDAEEGACPARGSYDWLDGQSDGLGFSMWCGACRALFYVTWGGGAPTIDDLVSNYLIDEAVAGDPPRNGHAWIFDDVLTAGTHFKAMQRVLSQRFPQCSFSGMFIAPGRPHGSTVLDTALDVPNTIGTIMPRDESVPRGRGTAFALDRRGVWVTAKHVVEGCGIVVLETAKRFLVVAQIHHDRVADISLIYTAFGLTNPNKLSI